MKKIIILLAIVMVAVLIGMQFPQKAMAQASGKVYEAAKGEINPVTDPAAIASLETKARNKQCGLIPIGPHTRAAIAGKGAIRLYVCGSSVEPYCITQAGRRTCYPPQP